MLDADIISDTVYLLGLYLPGLTIATLGSAGPGNLGKMRTALKISTISQVVECQRESGDGQDTQSNG